MEKLQEELNALLAQADAIVAGTEEGNLSEVVAKAEAIKAEIAELEKAQASLASLRKDIVTPAPVSAGGSTLKTVDTDIEDDVFAGYGKNGEAQFMIDVHAYAVTGQLSDKLGKIMAAAPQNPFTTRDTGVSFPTPEGFQSEVEEYDFDSDDEILSRFSFRPTSTGRLKYKRNELDNGLTAYWDDELDQLTESKMDWQKASLEVNRMTVATSASNEELADFPGLKATFNTEAPRAMNKKLLRAVLTGDGVAKPTGFLSGGHVVTVAKESGQTADTIVAANIAKMYSRLINGSRAFVMANSNCFPEFISLSQNGDNVWIPQNEGFKASPGGTLLGLPSTLNDYSEVLGDLGDIRMINPDGYKGLRLSGGITSGMSEHIYFDRHATMFKWLTWVGGEPIFENPYNPANSTGKQGSTRSHVVDLAARA